MNKSMIGKIKLLIVVAIIGVFVWTFILSPMLTFKSNEKKLEDAARRYYELFPNSLPTGERVGTVTLETLYRKSFIDKDIFIPLTKKTCSVTNSWVKVRKENGEYKNYTYLECGVMTSSIDHKGPEVKLNGDSNITLGVGEEFKDPGVKSVVDNKDGKIDVKNVTIKGKVDMLKGLKENVIIGKLIPAGTGAREYADVGIELEKEFLSDDASEILEEQLMGDEEETE